MARTSSFFGLAGILLTAAIGCGGSSPPTNNPGTGGSADVAEAQPRGDVAQVGAGEDEDESTADLAEHHRHHHHGGFAAFVAISLEQLNATPEQKAAIEKIRSDMFQKMEPAHDAEKVVLLALADGIAANKFDQPKLDGAIAQLSTASGQIHDAVAGEIDQLHETLTPPQRAALVDKVEAHFEVWHHSNGADEHKERDAHGGQLAMLGKQLGLSADQIEKARTSFEQSMAGVPKFDRSEAEAHMKAFGEAFASDKFDAKTLPTKGDLNAHMAIWGITRTMKFYEAVTPVLTPEQRTKLADSIRHHANYQHQPAAS